MTSVVFDLDGTLIDSAPDIHTAVTAMLSDVGAEPLSLATVRSFIGNGVSVLTRRVADARGLSQPHADLLACFVQHYDAHPARLTVLYPWVRECLTALAGSGHALGLCTNKPIATTRAILATFGLEQVFGVVLGGDSLPTHKPDPAPLHAAIAALGGGRSIFVGDSEVDAETATRAGVPFALFTEGYRKTVVGDIAHAARFSNFKALPDLVGRLMTGAA